MTKKNQINKFYVGAQHLADAIESGTNDSWTHPTLVKAVEHAKELLEQNPNQECLIVVEIRKIVRRQKRPVVVENI